MWANGISKTYSLKFPSLPFDFLPVYDGISLTGVNLSMTKHGFGWRIIDPHTHFVFKEASPY